MPKINWQDDRATLARIEVRINLQVPLIIRLPDDFKLTVDPAKRSLVVYD